MSRRNFILLIAILGIATIVVAIFLYIQKPATEQPASNEGTNFVSDFSPFGTRPTPSNTESTNNSDNKGNLPATPSETPQLQLEKVSSMSIAGFTAFQKERLKDLPTPVASQEDLGVPYNFGSATLKMGSSGDPVKEIQRFLNTTLNLNVELNGIFDAGIFDLVKRWQNDHGLTADGIIGNKTKGVMYSSVGQEVTGSTPTPPPTEFSTALRYVDQETGNIYQTFTDKIEERKFSDTIIPKVYDAYFGNDGDSVVMRYLKTGDRVIETFVGTLPKEVLGADTAGSNEITGTFLPNNVRDISISPDGSKMFYMFENTGNMIGTILNFKNNKKTQVFESAFTEWLSLWPNNNMITMSTKPSNNIPGYMYAINPAKKDLNSVMQDINGLTTLTSPDGKTVLYGENDLQGKLSLGIYHTDTGGIEPLGLETLPEKCAWGKGSNFIYCAVPRSSDARLYPDTWYQGEVSFNDRFWKIDAKTGNTTLLLDPVGVTGGEEVDGIKLALDENEDYLFFVNRKDNFLWEIKLK